MPEHWQVILVQLSPLLHSLPQEKGSALQNTPPFLSANKGVLHSAAPSPSPPFQLGSQVSLPF